MRDIEFRGKSLDTGKWVYGYLVSVSDKSRCTIFIPHDPNICDWATLPVAVDPATVGQYTGLTDRNGRQIYEGDIVTWPGTMKHGFPAVVGYCKLDAMFAILRKGYNSITLSGTCEYIEVVGNIYDNPELLDP